MKINYVKLKNFRSYGDSERIFSFPEKGTLLLSSANGTGKSSINTAILFCLFGKSPGNIDNLINRKIGKNLKVEVGFSVGADNYIAQRFRNDEKNGDDFYLYKNGENITSSKKKDTQQTVQDIIGVSYNTMMSSICFTKDNMVHFLAETPTKRLAILDSILNLKEISIWQDKVAEKKTELSESQRDISNNIDKIDTEVETDSKLIDNYEFEKKEKINSLRKQIADNEKKIFSIDSEVQEISSIDIEKEEMLIQKYNEAINKNAELDKRIAEEQKLLQGADKEIEEYNKNKIKLIDLRKINVEEELAKIDKYDKIEAQNKEIKLSILKLESQKEQLKEESDRRIIEINEQIKKTEENICHTCGQRINKEISDSIIAKLNEELKSETENLTQIKEYNSNVRKKNSSLKEQIDELKSQIKETTKPDFDRKTIMENKSVIDKIANEQKILEEKINLSSKNNSAISERIKELSEQKEKVPEKPMYSSEYLKGISLKLQKLNDQKTELLAVNKTLKSQGVEVLNQKDAVEELKRRITELSEKRAEINKKYKVNELKLRYFNLLYYLFSNKNDGLKKFIINKMIPMLNESIEKYMNYFFSGSSDIIKVSFDKDLNSIVRINGKEADYDDFSSGERQRLELATSFSLFFLVKNFFSSQLQFIIIDECLDEALDADGIKSAIDIINDLSQNNAILLISHREELKESFENKITIERDKKGFSVIKY